MIEPGDKIIQKKRDTRQTASLDTCPNYRKAYCPFRRCAQSAESIYFSQLSQNDPTKIWQNFTKELE
jgi:hypothetical protein